MIHRNTLIATPEVVYLGDSTSCKVLDAATGKLRDEITVPGTVSGGRVWKWMALDNGVLYALLGDEEYADAGVKGSRTLAGWPWTGLGQGYARGDYPWGFGHTLVAIRPSTKEVLWSHTEKELIDGRASCMNGSQVFFYSHEKFLGALDAATGNLQWRTSDPAVLAAIGQHDRAQNPRLGFSSSSYTKCSEEAIYFAGPQRKQLSAISAKDGKLLWRMYEDERGLQLENADSGQVSRVFLERDLKPFSERRQAQQEALAALKEQVELLRRALAVQGAR